MALIDDSAVALADNSDRDRAVQELIRLAGGQRPPLEHARDDLVRRLRLHSDDYDATAGLTVVNAALAEIGWPAPFIWEARKWRLHR
jgi:hypothetical protein